MEITWGGEPVVWGGVPASWGEGEPPPPPAEDVTGELRVWNGESWIKINLL